MKGSTIMELLVVLLLSSLIVSGLFTIYLNSKEHHIHNNGMQEIAEEISFVNSLWGRAIHGVGFLGFSSWNKVQVYDNLKQKILKNPVFFWNPEDADLPENIRKKMKPNTQAMELKQMDFRVTSLLENANKGDLEIMIEDNGTYGLKENVMILIANHQQAEINKIMALKKLSGQTKSILLAVPLYYSYAKDSYVGNYLDKIYFVGNTGHQFPDKKPIYGLYVYSENNMTEAITDLISDIHFWIGKKQNNVIYYSTIYGGENITNEMLLKVSVTLTLPYWVMGKLFSYEQEYLIAFRE